MKKWFLLSAFLCLLPIGPASYGKDLAKIAVWNLEPREVKVAYARELTSILVSEISRAGKYEVYSQDNVRTLSNWTAERMKLGCTDAQCLTILGQMDIAKLISGSVAKIGNRYSISLNLFDTQNAKSERSLSEFCRTEDELIDLVQKTAAKLLGEPTEAAASKKAEEKKELDKTFTNSIGMEFIFVPGGRFKMGSPEKEPGRYGNEGPQHEVQITRPFYLGKYEVRVSEFREFVKATNYKTQTEARGGSWVWKKDKFVRDPEIFWYRPGFSQADNHPVACISWKDAMEYCKWLGSKTGHVYRLPTEAEWEYACRAGSQEAYSFGPDGRGLEKHGWFLDNAGGKTHPVGQKKPNAWGFYDMHGNVWELCQDWLGNYASSFVVDPTGVPSGLTRVIRGGGWGTRPQDSRCAVRKDSTPADASNRNGFRLVRMP
jgi:formylglycine-generating enzyme required for sulfatase activity